MHLQNWSNDGVLDQGFSNGINSWPRPNPIVHRYLLYPAWIEVLQVNGEKDSQSDSITNVM